MRRFLACLVVCASALTVSMAVRPTLAQNASPTGGTPPAGLGHLVSDAPSQGEFSSDAAPESNRRLTRSGGGWFLTNDALGDRADRWRSGSLSVSQTYTQNTIGKPADDWGGLLELRFRGEVLQPDNLTRFDPTDRRYAGIIALGLHNHVQFGAQDVTFGGDLVMVGPRTEIDDVQSGLHDLIGGPDLAPAVRADQIQNRLRPTAVFEFGRRFTVGSSFALRPFAEARLGDESLARVGADLILGEWSRGCHMARDPVTGHRYALADQAGTGLSLILGADTAYVADSVYLPQTGIVQLEKRRDRVRAGMTYQRGELSLFYGLAWLGAEFDTQPEAQILGALQVQLRF